MHGDNPDDPQYDHAALRKAVVTAIFEAVHVYFRENEPALAPEVVTSIASCEQVGYELGEYIVGQNPYAACSDLNLPEIPSDPSIETRRIRKTGVLRDRTSFFHLAPHDQIPAGQVFDFIYPELHSLEDDELDTSTTYDQDQDTDLSQDSPNHMDIYRHNVIKLIRFRYNLLNRVENGHARPAYMLVLYSGGDA